MALVKKYRSEVVSTENPAPGIYVVALKSLEKPYRYKPGQFLHLALEEYNPSMPWPDSRCFSIRSNETEENIRITYSVKGEFTGRMSNELLKGKVITLKLPYGDIFTRPHSKEHSVFIAGGTGIVPFLSLFSSPAFNEYTAPKLYFGIKNSSLNIYEEELNRIKHNKPDFVIAISHEDRDGMIDINQIIRKNGKESFYFISGPPLMIHAFRSILLKDGIPETSIITDDWE